MKSELVTPAHLARRAVVSIRQSTPAQVVSHQESLRLQYALGERARELGWCAADVDVIDADLCLSGASAAGRDGFKEVAARVGLGEVGLVLSIDVTRLARNCTDWYPLLDICALRGCLIADRDGVSRPWLAERPAAAGAQGHDLRARAAHHPLAPDRGAAREGGARRARADPARQASSAGPGEVVDEGPRSRGAGSARPRLLYVPPAEERSGGHAPPQRRGPRSAAAGPTRRPALDAADRGRGDRDRGRTLPTPGRTPAAASA